jgi:hypothetical protein
MLEEEKYKELGGVYFPLLQQDGTRFMHKISSEVTIFSKMFLEYLRQHDR